MKIEAVPEQRRGGRPSRADAEKLGDKILDAAATLFFSHGYGHVSIEKIAQTAHISKRTLYARFENKAAIFEAVVRRVITRIRPDNDATDKLFEGQNVEIILKKVAPVILHASLSADSLALLRVVLAEATRFPELALIMHESSARGEALNRLAKLFETREKKTLARHVEPFFAAEQFLFMLTAAPQRRALGLGLPLTSSELNAWALKTVDLFLHGCNSH